ncbi:MAG: SH3 domain-containing protein [Armatimonadota bacterium]
MLVSRIRQLTVATCAAGLLFGLGVAIAAPPRPAWVIPEVLNVREKPGTDEKRIGQLKRGEKVYVVAFNNKWCRISYHGGKRGWAAEWLLQFNADAGRKLAASSPAKPSNPPAWVKGDSVNVRSGPSTSRSRIATASKGSKVYIVASQGGWHKVKLPSGQYGWIRGDLLERNVAQGQRLAQSASRSGTSAQPKAAKAYVNANGINVRSGPGSRFDRIDTLAKGTTVWVIDQQGQWRKVKYGNGEGGWVADWLLKYGGASSAPKPTLASYDRAASGAPQPMMAVTAWVAGDKVNIRYGPGMEFDPKTTVDHGTKVTVLDIDSHWCKVRLPDGTIGWVAGWVMDFAGPGREILIQEGDQTVAGRVGWVTAAEVNMRAGPGTSYGELAEAAKGTEVVLLDRRGEWYKIATSNNKVGWMHKQYVETRAERIAQREQSSDPTGPVSVAMGPTPLRGSGIRYGEWTGSAIVRTARSYLNRGIHYRFGGSSVSSGLDCSGYVQHVFAQRGIRLPHSSRSQYKRGVPIAKSQLQLGDVVFFKNTYRPGISHVGIYVGDGEFIHCSSASNGIVISRLDSNYYSKRYAGARRMK